MKLLTAAALAASMTTTALGATADGYMTIRGVGSVRCTDYTNAIATARDRWGLDAPESWNALNAYIQYFFGFLMGYNALVDGVYDIAAGIRHDNMPTFVLTVVDTYCRDHPTEVIDRALPDLLDKLRSTAKTGP